MIGKDIGITDGPFANAEVVSVYTRAQVIDDGIKRTTMDVARVMNEKLSGMTRLHTSTAIRMFLGLEARSGSDVRTRQDELSFLKTHWAAIDFAVSAIVSKKRLKGVSSAGVLAAVARAFYHEDRAVLQRFGRVLADGLSTDATDHPILRLRNWLIEGKYGQGAGEEPQRQTYGRAERVIHAYAGKIPLGRNILPVTTEQYPLPTTGRAS